MNSRLYTPFLALAVLGLVGCTNQTSDYDAHRLWFQAEDGDAATVVVQEGEGELNDVVRAELSSLAEVDTVVVRLRGDSSVHPDGFAVEKDGRRVRISARTSAGVLYAAFHIKRCAQTGAPIASPWQEPAYDLRLLNHWDNLDGTVERGYAGHSIWKWNELPYTVSPRYAEYARANASVGINGVVLNNVNASPEILSPAYLEKVKIIADVLRPYGQRVFLSVNFSSPMVLGGTPDADPLRPEVARWWQLKAREIYNLIPDFGGFLVKANSEGLPGPLDYGRSHAQGANMLASALRPYGGIVMWRAFVYSPSDADRAKQAYLEFEPHDGEFADNVIIQIKNGPIDFQPREPFSPLFGAMPQTNVMAEFQITQEYTGFSNHLCFLPSMWLETLNADTHAYGEGSTIGRITRGDYSHRRPTAIAGVANVGDEDSWCGHPMAQANWYAFGRMAWDSRLSAYNIAREWITLTIGGLPSENAEAVAQMMCQSREAVVDYMMPLGLHHIFAWGHHYGPEPWCDIEGARPDWMPSYYHRADSLGVGFDRSPSGSRANEQYAEPLASLYGSRDECPVEYLLWFHHVGWTDTLAQTGTTLWHELNAHYDRGLDLTEQFVDTWAAQKRYVSPALWKEVRRRLQVQHDDARWWHDACLLYFQTFSRLPLERETTFCLDSLRNFHLDISNYECPPRGYQ